jgi:hypothetical protein
MKKQEQFEQLIQSLIDSGQLKTEPNRSYSFSPFSEPYTLNKENSPATVYRIFFQSFLLSMVLIAYTLQSFNFVISKIFCKYIGAVQFTCTLGF